MEQYDALVGCMFQRPDVSCTYSTSVGCLFGSFVSLVFGDTTFLMNSIVPHAFLLTKNRHYHRGTGTGSTSKPKVESKFKDIYIGKIIQQKVDERHMSYAEFARQIHCARTSLYHIFNSKNIDVERLLLISDVLQYDFISEVYLNKQNSSDKDIPCIVLPFKNKELDLSHLPKELLEILKQQLQ